MLLIIKKNVTYRFIFHYPIKTYKKPKYVFIKVLNGRTGSNNDPVLFCCKKSQVIKILDNM